LQETFNDTRVTISGLNPVTTYRFQVFAENGVTAQAGEKDYADITVTTEASVPSSVANVRVTSVKSTEVSLAWDAPEDDLADIEMFEVSLPRKLYLQTLIKRACTTKVVI
jgi:Eph receptor B1